MKLSNHSLFLILLLFFFTSILNCYAAAQTSSVVDSIEIIKLCDSSKENVANPKYSLDKIDKAREIAESSDCLSCMGEVLTATAYLHESHNQSDSALYYYDAALAIFKESRNDIRALQTIKIISNVLESDYQYSESIENLKEGLLIGSDNEKSLVGLKGDLYLYLGSAYEEIAMYEKSLDALIKALEIFEAENDSAGISSCLINIGSIFINEENYSDAFEYTNRALEISNLIEDKQSISSCLNNLGNIFSYTNQHQEALNYFKQSLKIDRELKDEYGMAICLNNIGDSYKDLGDTVLAISYYMQCLEIAKPDNNLIIAVVLGNIAELRFIQGDLREALRIALEGNTASLESAAVEQILSSYSLLHKIYSEMGRYENAYYYLSEHQKLHDSIYSLTKTKYIQEVKAKYNDEKQRTEISNLKEKNVDESEIRKYLIMTILAISILIVSMFFINNVMRRSRRLLKKQKKYYERLLEYSEDFIFVIDETGTTKYISPSYERRIGREITARIGQSAFEFIHSDDIDVVKKEFQGLLEDKRPRNINFRMENAYGNWITVYAFGQNMIDDPTIKGIVVNFWDITQLKETEELISQSEVRFREIFNSFPDIYFQTDVKGVVTEISPSVYELIGYTREELLGITPLEYYHFIEDWKKIAARVEANSKIDDHDTVVKTKKGEVIHCSFSAENIYDDKNNHIGMKGVIRDISSRISNQRKLHESQVKLKEANKSKEKIFSIIAHDLIGPIGTNKSIVDLIVGQVDELTHEEIVTLITSLKPSLDSTYSLIENLLSWARIQQNRIVPNFEKISLERMLKLIAEILHGQAARKSIDIVVEGEKDIFVHGDQNQLDIVFRNIVSNSIKFSNHNSKIQIDYEVVDSMAEVRITDSGVGMPKRQVNKILSGKGTVENKRGTDNEKGTGFGLVIVAEFIKNNSGKLSILSKEGEGTTFIIQLPISKA